MSLYYLPLPDPRKKCNVITESATPAYDSLLYTVFQQLRAASNEGVVVAMTSATSGEGVTHSITALLNSLSRDGSRRILQVDAKQLREMTCEPASLSRFFKPIGTNIYSLAQKKALGPAINATYSWTGNWQYRRDCIKQLRSSFDYILVDCPAIKSAGDVFSLAPLVDGVIMVIEADKTRVDQILHAEKSIEFARGKLIGHILNKRSFDVPNWLYKLL